MIEASKQKMKEAGKHKNSKGGRYAMQKRLRKIHTWLSKILAVSMFISMLPFGLVQVAGNSSYPYGYISTAAGTGTSGYSGDGGLAISANLKSPEGIAVDNSGNLYIADTSNYRVRKVDAGTGTISTVAGTTVNGAVYSGDSGDGGPATSAAMKSPVDVAVYTSVTGSVYVYISDLGSNRVRKVDTSTGIITTVAGTGTLGYSGDGGPATGATIKSAKGIAVDSFGNLYIADKGNYCVRKVDASTGIISTVAGTGASGYSGDKGPATSAKINPVDVAVDSVGNLYIADDNYRISEVAATTHNQYGISMTAGNIYRIAGVGTTYGYTGDGGPATNAQIGYQRSLSLDREGNLYLVDSYYIRKIDTNGIITTVAGNGRSAYSGDGGLAISASLWSPSGVATDSAGSVYIADRGNNVIRKVYLPLSTPALKTITISNSPNLNYGGSPLTFDLSNLTIAGADQFGAVFDINGYTPVWSVKAGPATVSGSTLTITGSGAVGVAATVYGLTSNTLIATATLNAPALNADATDNVYDKDITLTFTDDSNWRGAITGITVDGNALTASQYKVSAGTITFPVGVLATTGSHNIAVKAAGYADATVVQSIIGVITAGSFAGVNTVTEWDVNADGLTITIGLNQGYSFADDVSSYKDAIIDGLSFNGVLLDKTGSVTGQALTYYPVSYDTFITKGLNAYSGIGYFPYIDTVYNVVSNTYSSPNQITTYDRFVGLDPKGAQSTAIVTDELKAKYPGVKKGIINALKAGATVSVNSEGKLVIRATKDAANGYFSTFTNGVPVVNGGVQIANCDILLSADLPPGVVKNVNEFVRTSGYYTIQEMKIHQEVWEYVDESRKDEAGVFKFDTRIYGADRNTSTSYPYSQTYYVKKIDGNVLTEEDIRNGGTMGPNGTGNKLIKLVIDDRVGPTQWASAKNMSTFFTNLFRTSKDAAGYSGYSSTTYTPADDPMWLKVEDQITNGGTDQNRPYDVSTNKYVINYCGDSRGDVINPASMWMFYELPKTPDFDISSDMTIYLNMIAGFYGGSGQSTPQNGQPVLGMDGRYSFTIKATTAVTGVGLDEHTATLTPGANRTLTATVAPTDATNKNVTWTTSDSNVATVTNGVVTATGAGTATITVTTADGSFTDTCAVTVNPAAVAVTGVGLDEHTATLTPGANRTLTATVAPTDATNKNITWTTSDSNVATVTNGVVTAVRAGTATITVTTADGSFTDTCQVTVNPATTAVTGVGLDEHTATLTPGANRTLTATVAPTDATNKNVTWTTSDSNVATVTNGVVTAAGAGTATITVTTADGSFTDTCTVTVNPATTAVTGVGLDEHTVTLTPGANRTLTATVAPADATNKNVTWTTSDSNVATVTNGVITAAGAGTATITVTTADGSFTDTCKVTVNAAPAGGGGGGGGGAPTTTPQTPATDLGQVTQSENTATVQVEAKKVADLLKDAAQSELVINLAQITAESGRSKAVQLPAEVIDIVKTGKKPIVIQDSGLTIVIPSEVLIQGKNMTFSTTQVSSQTVASAPEHVEKKVVYSFDASAGESAVHNFTKSITITLPIPAGVTRPEKLGVYYLNETTGQWDYMGGRIVNGKLVFKTNHFSKYMVAESQKTFGDLASHWAKADIEVMVARHIINGIDEDTFAPQNNITRAEFAALLSRVLNLSDAAGEGTFKDITGSEWYANEVLKAAKAGIIQGSDGSFRPGDHITREEMAVMINRAYSYTGGKIDKLQDLTFTDKGSISEWANDAVQSVYTLGIINGYPDGSFGGLNNATRAEGTVMLKTFMDKLGL